MSGTRRLTGSHGNNQIKCNAEINAETAACPKRQAAFIFVKRTNCDHRLQIKGKQMKKHYFGIYRMRLLPAREINKEVQKEKRIIKAE